MGIPNKFDRLGAITTNKLPAGYLAAEFLESTGTQYVMTGFFPDDTAEIKIDTNPLSVPQGLSIWLLANANLDRTEGGRSLKAASSPQGNLYFEYGSMDSTGAFGVNPVGPRFGERRIIELKNGYYDTGLTKGNFVKQTFSTNLVELSIFRNIRDTTLSVVDIYSCVLSKNEKLEREFVPMLDRTGTPCMFDKVSKQPFYNAGTGQFIVGMTIVQARQLSKLPITEAGTLTVSLPWEAQWDEGVQHALSLAATKGWTITVQYRDPEVATTNIPISFLESTGTQFIKATAIFNNNTKLEMLARQTESATHPSFFGTEHMYTADTASKRFSCLVAGSTGQLRFDYGSRTDFSSFYIERGVCYKITKDAEKNYIDDVLVYSNPPTIFDGLYGVLFARGAGVTGAGANGGIKGAIYWCNVFNAGIPEHTFIPALTEKGIPCMYDKVTKTQFLNSGGGQFIAGFNTIKQALRLATLPDVIAETNAAKKSLTVSLPWEARLVSTGVPAALQIAMDRGWTITVQYREPEVATENIRIDYLESTGTQYIDTGLIATDATEFEADAAIMSASGTVLGQNNVNYQSGYYCVRASGRLYMRAGSQEFSFGEQYTAGEKTTFFKKDGKIGFGSISQNLSVESYTGKASLFLFARRSYSNDADYAGETRIWHAEIKNNGTEYKLVAGIDKDGKPCMYDRVTKQSFPNSGTGSFVVGFETTDKAALGLSKLPTVEAGTLTVSLPWEAQLVITGVPAALQVAKGRGWTITVQYRDPEQDNAVYNKYAACTTVAEMTAVNADYKSDLTADGEWIYPLPKLQNGQSLWQSNYKLKRVGVAFPELTNAYLMLGSCDNIEEINVSEFPKVTNADYWLRSYKLKTFKCKFSVLTRFYGTIMNCSELWSSEIEAPMLTEGSALHSNCSNLSHFRCTLGKLATGGNMLNNCILDKDSAIHVLTTIPAWTDGNEHKLTIGIHVDHELDEEIATAIADAEANGWTIEEQWNGTATAQAASTFGLRRKPVYAKVGSMVLPDGTAEQYLSWGHYVTNWEDNGYKEFSSIEEAEEYFNINQTEEV